MIDFMAGIKIAGDFVERVDVFWVALALFSILFGIGSVFFYNYELLKRVKLEKTSVVSAVGIIAAELCQKLEISERFFLALTEKFYAPLFAVLLLWAGFSGKRKHNIKTALLLLGAFSLCLFSLSGCGVSLEDRVFPLSMGADYAQGEYQLIYGIPELTQITGQNKEDTEETQAQAVVYGGKRPQDAEENFNKNQEKYLDMGHIKVLILGKELLENRGAMEEFLAYMEGKPAVAGNLYVFSCKDVGEVMSLDGQGRESVGDYLSGILENNLDKKEKQAVTLQDLYNAWHRKEKMPKLPSVTVVNKRPRLRQYS